MHQWQVRTATSAELEAENLILREGEVVFEKDTRRIKVGDGITHWLDLEYAVVGIQGPPGPRGPKGDKGEKGDPGESFMPPGQEKH